MRLTRLFWLIGLLGALVLGGCSRDDNTGGDEPTAAPTVDFLMFPNPQSSLGVGDYALLFANAIPPVNPTPYTLTIAQTDGTTNTFTGNLDPLGNIITHNFEVRQPGGVAISLNTSGVIAQMAIRVGGATTNLALSSVAANPTIDLPRHQIDSTAYAQAYYAAIDPTNLRDTLAKFKATNGFSGNTCSPTTAAPANPLVLPIELEVRFRDVIDLGYGRHMCVRQNANGDIAAWVENFQVTAIPGIKYGPLNLEAVLDDDRRWHVGTNAIEFSPGPGGGARFVKFYTYNPDGTRRLLVDLDDRGAKAMPIPCISCHGGHALPLTAAGLFPAIRTSPRGDALARMQPINVGTLDFGPNYPYRRVDQEGSLKGINQMVLCSFPIVGAAAGAEDNCRTAAANLEWGGTAASMVKSWYGGNGLPSATFGDAFVPDPGWTDAGAGVAGAQNLYRTVVATSCRVCHILRGNQNEHGIDFVTYAKFAGTNPATGYNDRIKHHVFDRGNMPLALLKFEQFWESGAPTTLASFIAGATDGNGNALQPTRPVAKPGPNRTIVTGVPVKLHAAESVNAISYRWRITSANAASATLINADSIRPTFTANVNGVYTLELIVSDGNTDSAPVTLTIGAVASLVDGAGLVTIADPAAIRFLHIRTILQDNAVNYFCASCHVNTDASGPPVYYNDYDRDGDSDVDAADLHQFYLDIRARVNFTDIESSRILFRPSGHHHPGGLITNFNDTVTPGSAGRGAYDIFLNWILNGAPE